MLYRRLEDGTIVLASQVKKTKDEEVIAEAVLEVVKPTASPVVKTSIQDKPVATTKEVLDGKI